MSHQRWAKRNYGYLTNYSTVTGALANDGYSFSASNEPPRAILCHQRDAKTMGLVSVLDRKDGFIGFSTLPIRIFLEPERSVGPTNSGTEQTIRS